MPLQYKYTVIDFAVLILQNAPSAKVNLRTPDKTFFGIITNQKLVFGIKLAEIIPKPFVERRARKKPYFHPSAMNAKMARCMGLKKKEVYWMEII